MQVLDRFARGSSHLFDAGLAQWSRRDAVGVARGEGGQHGTQGVGFGNLIITVANNQGAAEKAIRRPRYLIRSRVPWSAQWASSITSIFGCFAVSSVR